LLDEILEKAKKYLDKGLLLEVVERWRKDKNRTFTEQTP